MGLFGSKKVYVSSSIYNLAGDELDRPNFLKSSLFSAVMNPHEAYLGEVIVGNYLTGPGIMQRSFYNWAIRNDIAGLPTLSISNATPIDAELVVPYIPVPVSPAGLETRIQSVEVTDGDYEYWAEKWLFENNPSAIPTEWIADYDSDAHIITIQYEDGSTDIFSATNYDKNKKYIIARYIQVVPSSVEPLVVGIKTEGVESTPPVSGYTLDSTVNTGSVDYSLNQQVTVTKVYSDGSPTTVDTTYPTVIESFNGLLSTYNRTDYIGSNSGADDTSSIEKWLYIWEYRVVADRGTDSSTVVVNDMGGGETETVTTVTSGEFLFPIYDHQLDQQETIFDKIDGNNGIWIYELDTGIPALDAIINSNPTVTVPEYYPFLPIRLNNVSIRDAIYETLYKETKKAYRKATGGPMKGDNLDLIIDEVEANVDIGDIDYSYVQWGVSVNVLDPSCRRYMYEWFKNMIPNQNTSPAYMNQYKDIITNYDAAKTAMEDWVNAQSDPYNALYGTPKPPDPNIKDPQKTTVRLIADHPSLSGFDNRFTWVNITETSHSGLGKTDAETGDIWWETGETVTWNVQSGFAGRDGDSYFNLIYRSLEQMILVKQTSPTTHTKLTIWGMEHNNYIYGGKSVRTTLKEGVADTAESVFIVPLHAPTVQSLGIKDFTQMALSNTFITFNSYKVVKKKWYQTFLGMLFIVIAIVVVAALISPTAVGGVSGFFGTNAAVGASLGLSGTAAIVAGAVTNAIAAVIIAQTVSSASVAIFGAKWGAIIGAIVSFAVSFGMANGFSNLTFSSMMNPQTLLQFSNALANGYSGYVAAELAEIGLKTKENQNAYDKAIKDLEDLMRSMGLTNDLLFNPMDLTNSVKGNGDTGTGSYVPETLDQFISRTTMTGSDIVDFTLSMVEDYSDLQLTLPKR